MTQYQLAGYALDPRICFHPPLVTKRGPVCSESEKRWPMMTLDIRIVASLIKLIQCDWPELFP